MAKDILIGVDIGGTTIKLAFFNLAGEFITKWEIPTDKTNQGESVVADIDKTITEKLAEEKIDRARVAGIGVGAPGPFERGTGMVYSTVNIGWKNYPLRELLEKATGLPVIADNDANIAALGEMWLGAGAGATDLICITLGTGVGGGIITNRKIVQGKKGCGGEIGHMTSLSTGGAPCNCGKSGCLETIVSATGIARRATERVQVGEPTSLTGEITAKDVFTEAEKGDTLALEIVEETAYHLGLGLSHLANVLNPDKIVIGGGVSKAGDILLDKVKTYFEQFCFSVVRESTVLDLAQLGNDAGVIGGAYLVQNYLLK